MRSELVQPITSVMPCSLHSVLQNALPAAAESQCSPLCGQLMEALGHALTYLVAALPYLHLYPG